MSIKAKRSPDVTVAVAPESAPFGLKWGEVVHPHGKRWFTAMGPLTLVVEAGLTGVCVGQVHGLERRAEPLKRTSPSAHLGQAQAATVRLARELLVRALQQPDDIIEGSWARAFVVGEILSSLHRCAALLKAGLYKVKLKDQAFAGADLWGDVQMANGELTLSFRRGIKPKRRHKSAAKPSAKSSRRRAVRHVG